MGPLKEHRQGFQFKSSSFSPQSKEPSQRQARERQAFSRTGGWGSQIAQYNKKHKDFSQRCANQSRKRLQNRFRCPEKKVGCLNASACGWRIVPLVSSEDNTRSWKWPRMRRAQPCCLVCPQNDGPSAKRREVSAPGLFAKISTAGNRFARDDKEPGP